MPDDMHSLVHWSGILTTEAPMVLERVHSWLALLS